MHNSKQPKNRKKNYFPDGFLTRHTHKKKKNYRNNGYIFLKFTPRICNFTPYIHVKEKNVGPFITISLDVNHSTRRLKR